MRASFKHPRVEFSFGAPPPPPPSLGDLAADEFINSTAVDVPLLSASDVASIRHTLDTAMTVQAANG